MDESQEEWDITDEDERYFARLSASVAEMKVADYLAKHPQPLKDSNQLLADFQDDLKTETIHTYHETIAGYQALAEGLDPLLNQLDDDEAFRVKREYGRWIAFVLSINSPSDFFDTVLKSGKSLQEAFFLSNETMSYFYQVGRSFLQEKEFIKARSLFFLLSHLNGGVYEFWLGLAIAYQELGDVEKAIAAYRRSRVLKETDPTVDLFLADCYLHMNVKQEAEEYLHTAKEKMTKSQEFAYLKPKFRQISKKLKALS